MLIKLENGVPTGHPVDDYNFRILFPGVSFPRYLTPDDVESFGFGMYEYSQQPALKKYEKMVEAAPTKKEDGVWYQTWEVVEMSAEEKAQADERQALLVREMRNGKLRLSDWTQISDSSIDGTTWLAYRQALRDVPSQTGFPWEVVWPEEPA